VEIVSFYLIS